MMLRQAATTFFHPTAAASLLTASNSAKRRPKGRTQGELGFLPSREATNLSVQHHVFIQASDLCAKHIDVWNNPSTSKYIQVWQWWKSWMKATMSHLFPCWSHAINQDCSLKAGHHRHLDLRTRDQTAPDASQSPSASAAADRCPPFARRCVRRRPASAPGALWISASHREKLNLGTGWALLMTMVVTVYAHLLGTLKREFIQTYLYVSWSLPA